MEAQIQKKKIPQLLVSLMVCQGTNLISKDIRAEVNMKNASFLFQAQDIKQFDITRTYNSRSLHNGIFGFGWCSNIEKQIQHVNKNQIYLNDCSKESKLEFNKVNENPFKVIYQAKGNGNNQIVYESGTYTHFVDRKVTETYNRRGQLSYFQSSGGTTVVTYEESGRLARVLRGDRVIHVLMDHSKNKIKSLTTSENQITIYEYELDNLTKVSGTSISDYIYDPLNNLVQIKHNNVVTHKILYDKDKDWVSLVEKANHCKEFYEFLGNSYYQKSILHQKCTNSKSKTLQYEFWYQLYNQTKYLSRFKLTTEDKTFDVYFDSKSGKPFERKPSWEK